MTRIIGVVSDTHLSDRAEVLSPLITDFFRQAGVCAILHGGDISDRRALDELSLIAPVTAVQGNRDWLRGLKLPVSTHLNFDGVSVTLTHGHLNLFYYLLEKVYSMRGVYDFGYFYRLLSKRFPQARVVIYGHTHNPENRWINGQLFFNPGAGYPCRANYNHPMAGLLYVSPGEQVRARYFYL